MVLLRAFALFSFSGCYMSGGVSILESDLVKGPISVQKVYLDTVQITMSEGSVAIINVALTDYLKKDLSVALSLNDPEHRFQSIANTLLIPAGALSQQVILQTIDDNIYQGNQIVTLSIASSEATVSADPNTLTINLLDNDPLPSVQLSSASQNINENANTVSVSVLLSAASGVDVTVPIIVSGTAIGANDDYLMGTTLPVVIPAGSTSASVNLTIIDDSVVELDETIIFTLGVPTNASGPPMGGVAVHTLTLIDNDVNLSISDVTVTETSGNAIFSISISKISIQNVQVNWATANGTALAGTNFATSTGTATISAGNLTTTVTVPIIDSPDVCAGNRIFYVNLSSPVNGVILDSQGLGTIQENDYPTLSISSMTVEEGLMADPIVSLSQACDENISFNYSTADNTAAGFLDFFPMVNMPLTIAAGATSIRTPVTLFNDMLAEGTESFSVTISNPSRGSILPMGDTGQVTINDNDLARAAATDVAQIKTGNNHVCILTTTGVVKCWGRNDHGQLGQGIFSIKEEVPTVVDFASVPATALSASWKHGFGSFTCAVVGGAAKCWGYNTSGQLGNSSVTTVNSPVTVTGLSSNVTDIATGGTFACAVVAGGVKCWGSNSYGQLGNSTTVPSTSPVDVTGLGAGSGVLSISAGSETACAILGGGTSVKCWGRNDFGQLGNNSTISSSSPVDVININSGATKVSNATYHTCALVSGGVKCWGGNGYGQLGNGNNMAQLTPVDVSGLTTDVVDMGVGGDDNTGNPYSCGVLTSGAVKCWGKDSGYSHFGPATPGATNIPFANSAIPSGASLISLSIDFVCAKIGLGVSCWGDDNDGYFARIGSQLNLKPFDTLFTANVSGISIGGHGSSCVIVNGGVKCFGANGYGQLGNSSYLSSYAPADVSGLPGSVSKVAISGNGSGGDGQAHTCAITSDGALRCWGANGRGQVGDNSVIHRNAPVMIFANGVQDVDVAFGNHTCAILSTGALKCWGRNDYGQLGNGLTSNSSVPIDPIGLSSGVTQVAGSQGHTCAIVNGGVKCWGSNGHGELGLGSAGASILTPQDVPGLSSGVTSISSAGLVSNSKTCVVQNGGVKCWGRGSYGALGNGSLIDKYSPTAAVGLGSEIVKVKVNERHACALTTSGALKCWGANYGGEVGVGDITQYSSPVSVPGMQAGILDVDLGENSTCVLVVGGSVKCWGNNLFGSLGLGYSFQSVLPVEILFP
ncbi:MAG: hypothetical protein IPK04_08375 [Bdellovibrionales bacterium]|nr:hypothetical protein [Bdellovibrionales bacterium]